MTISKEFVKNVENEVDGEYKNRIDTFLEGFDHGASITFNFVIEYGLLKDGVSGEDLMEKFEEYLKSNLEDVAVEPKE